MTPVNMRGPEVPGRGLWQLFDLPLETLGLIVLIIALLIIGVMIWRRKS